MSLTQTVSLNREHPLGYFFFARNPIILFNRKRIVQNFTSNDKKSLVLIIKSFLESFNDKRGIQLKDANIDYIG